MKFTKYNGNKARFDLIPPKALWELANVFTYGCEKYSADNWRKCPDVDTYIAAAMRHLLAYSMGESLDSESDLHTLAHAAASCVMALGLTLEPESVQDLRDRSAKAVANGRAAKKANAK